MNFRHRLFRFIVGLDQAMNPLVYGCSEDITISAQTGYREVMLNKSKRTRRAIDYVFGLLGQKDHCYNNLLSEIDEFPDQVEIRAKLAERGII